MDRKALSGLSPIWLISLAMVLGVTVVTLVPITIAGKDPITPGSWIGFCGSVLGGCLAVIGFFMAANNVNRQLRVNLISREESRIEEQLPQMEQLIDHVIPILGAANEKEVWRAIRAYRDTNAGELPFVRNSVRDLMWTLSDSAVEARMPLVDPTHRRRFYGALSDLKLSLTGDDSSVVVVDDLRYHTGLALLEILFSETNEKISSYKKRLVVFRAELERYFER